MNILHFSTQDVSGGAAKAAYRLHTSLRDRGHCSKIIVRYKQSQDIDVEQAVALTPSVWKHRLHRVKNRVPMLRAQQPATKYESFNFDLEQPVDLEPVLSRQKQVDVVCLHWISSFLTVSDIKRIHDYYRCPLVLVLMDQEPLTGGCHYSFDCQGYTQKCGNCPQLTPRGKDDSSHIVWERKRSLLSDLPITLIAANSWASGRISKSSLFGHAPVAHIAIPIDTTRFRPVEQRFARDLLQIPEGKKVLFFGAYSLEDPRKGMKYLADALHQLTSLLDNPSPSQNGSSHGGSSHGRLRKEDVFLLIAGSAGSGLLESLPFGGKMLGLVQDELVLALAYQAADAFACPSVEDGGPMMISEALLCGTPVVAFNSGIAPDLIETMSNGYVADYKDSRDLARGIHAILAADPAPLRAASREAALKMHDPQIVTQQYESLLLDLIAKQAATATGAATGVA